MDTSLHRSRIAPRNIEESGGERGEQEAH